MHVERQSELFREWFEQYHGLIARVARAYTATPADCEDLIQESLFQVWRSIPRFEGRASPSTWVYRVALNTALRWRRTERQRWRLQPLSEFPELAEPKGEPAAEAEKIERLYAAIRLLPKADAALVVLYLDDLSYREMGEVLGISETHVGVKLNRVRKALAEIINETAYESRS